MNCHMQQCLKWSTGDYPSDCGSVIKIKNRQHPENSKPTWRALLMLRIVPFKGKEVEITKGANTFREVGRLTVVNVSQQDKTPTSEPWTSCTTHRLRVWVPVRTQDDSDIWLYENLVFALLARARTRPGAAVLLVWPRGKWFLLEHKDTVQWGLQVLYLPQRMSCPMQISA